MQLATKQVWRDTTQWKGWVMCAQQTVPESFAALLALPPDVLSTTVKDMPGTIQQQLLQFATGNSVIVPTATLAAIRQLQPATA